MTGPSAARRYKDITGELNAAVQRLKRHDAQRVHELGEELPGLEKAMAAAVERRNEVEAQANELWESTLDQAWNEQWMTPGRIPEPASDVRIGHVDYLLDVAEQRLEALRESVRRRRLLGQRGRRPPP